MQGLSVETQWFEGPRCWWAGTTRGKCTSSEPQHGKQNVRTAFGKPMILDATGARRQEQLVENAPGASLSMVGKL